MAKVKVFKRKDGKVSIIKFNFSMKNDGESDEDFIERVTAVHRQRQLYSGAEEYVLDESDIPSDRATRDGWNLKNGKIEVDLVKVAEKEAIDKAKSDRLTELKGKGNFSSQEVTEILKEYIL